MDRCPLLNEATEQIAQFLRQTWERVAVGAVALTAPADRWREAEEPAVDFAGFQPRPARPGDVLVVGNPVLAVRLGLAQRVVEHER